MTAMPAMNHVSAQEQLIRRIRKEREVSPRSPFIAAIDGRCGAGKTTLAVSAAEMLGAPLIHMDDFFLRPEQRSPERLARPGENIDHERFLEEVLIPLSEGRECAYRPFSCFRGELGEPVTVEHGGLVLVEGSYAHHPALTPYYGLRIFLTVSPEEQLRRIRARNGESMAEVFRDRWIPLEEKYFSAFHIQESADLTLSLP